MVQNESQLSLITHVEHERYPCLVAPARTGITQRGANGQCGHKLAWTYIKRHLKAHRAEIYSQGKSQLGLLTDHTVTVYIC